MDYTVVGSPHYGTSAASAIGGYIQNIYNPSQSDSSATGDFSSTYSVKAHNDIWLNRGAGNINWGDTERGDFAFYTILHELSHALGVKEPISASLGSQMKFTVTAGDFHPSMNQSSYYVPSSLMLYDILALQEIFDDRNYGTRASGGLRDTEYKSGQGFVSNVNSPFMYSIWDGDGVDTINSEDFADKVFIDLRQGHFSSIGKAVDSNFSGSRGTGLVDDNVSIAFHTIIENAKGTASADEIIGNAWDNKLEGGAGNDKLYGDGVVYDGSVGFGWAYPEHDPNNPASRAGLDKSGNDTLIGGAGNDELRGGAGYDIADYSTDPSGINYTSNAGFGYASVIDGNDDSDTLHSLEGVLGSNSDDEFQIHDLGMYIDGKDGDDTVILSSPVLPPVSFPWWAKQSVEFKADGSVHTGNGSIIENVENVEIAPLEGSVPNYDFYAWSAEWGNSFSESIVSLSYQHKSSAVTVNFATGSVSGSGGSDSFHADHMTIYGTDHGDTYGASSSLNTIIHSGTGDDTINGTGRIARYYYEGGADVVEENAKIDVVYLDESFSVSSNSLTFTLTSAPAFNQTYENYNGTNYLVSDSAYYDVKVDFGGGNSITFEDRIIHRNYVSHGPNIGYDMSEMAFALYDFDYINEEEYSNYFVTSYHSGTSLQSYDFFKPCR